MASTEKKMSFRISMDGREEMPRSSYSKGKDDSTFEKNGKLVY